MYEIYPANVKVEKRLNKFIKIRKDVAEKLKRLSQDPRKSVGAHPLHGKLSGKWACWLGADIRMIYIIDDVNKRIDVDAVGSHKIY